MNLQKLLRIVLIVMYITVTVPAFSTTVTPYTESTTPVNNDTREKYLINRLQEIKAMTKHDLSRAEKKALRKEVKEIKKELKGGVYLSVGAIIIIILLLILLL